MNAEESIEEFEREILAQIKEYRAVADGFTATLTETLDLVDQLDHVMRARGPRAGAN